MDTYFNVNKKLMSLPAVRRGNYVIKVSVCNGQILLVASHATNDLEKIFVRSFWNPDDVYKFIDMIIEKDNYE